MYEIKRVVAFYRMKRAVSSFLDVVQPTRRDQPIESEREHYSLIFPVCAVYGLSTSLTLDFAKNLSGELVYVSEVDVLTETRRQILTTKEAVLSKRLKASLGLT